MPLEIGDVFTDEPALVDGEVWAGGQMLFGSQPNWDASDASWVSLCRILDPNLGGDFSTGGGYLASNFGVAPVSGTAATLDVTWSLRYDAFYQHVNGADPDAPDAPLDDIGSYALALELYSPDFAIYDWFDVGPLIVDGAKHTVSGVHALEGATLEDFASRVAAGDFVVGLSVSHDGGFPFDDTTRHTWRVNVYELMLDAGGVVELPLALISGDMDFNRRIFT